MRKWYAIIIVLVIGIAIATALLFFISEAPPPETAADTPRRGFVSFFGSGFGFTNNTTEPASESSSGTTTPEQQLSFRQQLRLARMIPLSREMVSGVTFTASTTVSTTSPVATPTIIEHARFVERETGHIYDLSLETGNVKRISNTTIPRIQEAHFGVNGSAVALRYLADDNETVETYVSPLPTDPFASSTTLAGTFFRQNIAALAFAPDTREIFYLTAGDTGATGRIAGLSGQAARVVFSLPLSEWQAHWETPGYIDLTTAPSYLASGAGERVTTSGAITRTFAGTRGLTTLPNPDGTRILFSSSDGNVTRIFIRDLASRTNTEFLIPTLPEKCVWVDAARVICAVPSRIEGSLPDAWYQGSVSFNDSFWMLDGVSGTVDFLFDPAESPARESVDAIDLALSYDNTVLTFMNKKDLRGWVADISNEVTDE